MRAVLLLHAAAVVSLIAQTSQPGAVSGRVLDETGASVPNATAVLIERQSQTRRSSLTGLAGDFEFNSVRAGDYLLQASAAGFGQSAPQPVRIENSGQSGLTITLTVDTVSTSVQVTATGMAQTADEQAKAIDTVDRLSIETRNEFSVVEAIRQVPGMRVQQLGGPASFTRILTRGMRSSDTSVLIDGFRFRDAAAPQGDISSFASDLLTGNVERVEVLRGSGSSLYGTNATSGVVNVITDQGGGRLRGDLGFEGGGLGLFRGSAGLSGGAFDDRLRFSGTLSHLNLTEGVDSDDRARNSVAHGFAHLDLTSRTSVKSRLIASNGFQQINDSPFAIAPIGPGQIIEAIPDVTFTPALNDPDNRRSSEYLAGLVALTHLWSPRLSSQVSYHSVVTRRDSDDGPAGIRFEPMFNDFNRFDGRLDTLQARADLFAIRGHTFTAGYEFEREDFDNLSRSENPADPVNARVRINQHSHAVFAQDQIRMAGDRLQVSLSGRRQSFNISRPSLSGPGAYDNAQLSTPPSASTGDASAAWFWPGTRTKIRAHAGNSYRAPGLYERFGASFFFGAFSVLGDPRLGPERLASVDAGIDQYFGSRVRLSATWFYTRIQKAIIYDVLGLITPENDPFGRFGGYMNTGGGLARGFEFKIEAKPARTTQVLMSYTFTNADERAPVLQQGLLRSVRVSDHMYTLTALQRVGTRFNVAFDLFAASDYLVGYSGRAFRFEGPVKADLSVNYTIPLGDRQSVRLFSRIENILNRTYYEDGFRAPTAWAVGGLRYSF